MLLAVKCPAMAICIAPDSGRTLNTGRQDREYSQIDIGARRAFPANGKRRLIKAKYEEFRNCLFGRTAILLDGSNIKGKIVISVRLNQD